MTSLAPPQAALSSVSRYSRTDPAGPGEIVPVDRFRSVRGALLVGVGPDQARVDREALATNQPFVDAAPDGRLE